MTSLLQCAARLSLPMLGVSFHCGSGCYDVTAYVTALHMAAEVMHVFSASGVRMQQVYISGGISPSIAGQSIDDVTAQLLELSERGVSIAMEAGK